MKPLDGKLVLDLTRLLPGALVTQNLASLGAEVWKVEAPGQGDYARSLPPLINGTGAYFIYTNSWKKSIALHLKHEEGKRVFLRLILKADILVEGFRPGVMERLGLGYDQLAARNPRLVHVALTGYGQDGPYAQKPGHDLNYAAMAGLLHCANGTKPVPLGVQVADVAGAQQALIGALGALLARERTGIGQKVDVSVLGSLLPMLTVPLAEYAATGNPAGAGFLTGKYACYNTYQTADGRSLALGALEEKFWSAFCIAVEREALIAEQFVEAKQPELIATLAMLFRGKTSEEWLELVRDVDTCLTPVNDVASVLNEPQLAAWGEWFNPAGPGRTPDSVGTNPPKLGEHTGEILERTGLSGGEIAELVRLGVVECSPE